MAKFIPNPHGLGLFHIVMTVPTGNKTEVSVYADSLVDAKSKITKLFGFPIVSGRAAKA